MPTGVTFGHPAVRLSHLTRRTHELSIAEIRQRRDAARSSAQARRARARTQRLSRMQRTQRNGG